MNLPLPFLLAIGVAAGVWMILLAFHIPTLHASLAVLGTVACFGPAFAKWNLGPFSASPDRLAFMLLICLVILKRILTVQPKLALDRSDLFLAALLVLVACSIYLQPSPPRTERDSPTPAYLFIASYLSPALFYWVARFRLAQNGDARVIVRFFVLFGVYLAFTAVCESHGGDALVFPRHILKTRTQYEGRSVGPFLSSPGLGTWLTVASASLVVLWFRVRGIGRVMLAGVFPLFAYAQYLTETRSAWMGFVAAVPLAALLSVRGSQRHAIVVLLTVCGLIGGLFAGERFMFPDRKEGRGVVAYSTIQRLSLLQRSLSMFVQRPVTGWGFGQFEHAARIHGGGSPLQIVASDDAEQLASHNVFLRFLAELGLVGFSLLLLVLGSWLAVAHYQLKTATPDDPQRPLAILFVCMLVAYVAEAMFHDATFIPQDHMLLFLMAGLMHCNWRPLPTTPPSVAAKPLTRPPVWFPNPGPFTPTPKKAYR